MSIFNKEREDIERLHKDEAYRKETLMNLKEQANVRKEVKTISKLRSEERAGTLGVWWRNKPLTKK